MGTANHLLDLRITQRGQFTHHTVSLVKIPGLGMAHAHGGGTISILSICHVYVCSHKLALLPALLREAAFPPTGGD